MAITAASLVVKVSGETKPAEDALDRLNKKTKESGGFFQNLLSTAAGTFSGMMGVQSVTDTVGFLKDQLVDSVQAGMEAQQMQAQLAQGIKSTNDASGETVQGLDDLADKYSKVTTFSKTAIEHSEAITLTFTNIGKNVFPQATMAAEDMSTRLGIDLPSATMLLDKALQDPIKGIAALHRVGVDLSAQQIEQVKHFMAVGDAADAQKIILGEVNKEMGGSATAAGQTFAGQLQILQNQLENTKEKIGEALLPVLNQLLQAVMPLAGVVGQVLTGALGGFSSFLTGTLMPALSRLSPLVQQVQQWFSGLLGGLKSSVGPLGNVQAQFEPLIASVQKALPTFEGLAGSIGQHLLPLAQALGTMFEKNVLPILGKLASFVLTQVLPVMVQLETFWEAHLVPILNTLFDVFRTDIIPILNTLWANIQANVLPAIEKIWHSIATNLIPALERLWAKISPVLIPALRFLGGLLKDTLTPILNVVGWVIGNVVGPAISGAVSLIGNMIDAITTIITKIGDFLGILGKVKDGIGGAFSAVGNALHGLPIPGLAEGGDTPGGPVIVGEHGPELMVPPSGFHVYTASETRALLGGSISGLPTGMSPAYGMASGTMNGQPIQLVVNLDGRTVAQIVTKHQPSVIRQATGTRNF
jgi:phage-related protein